MMVWSLCVYPVQPSFIVNMASTTLDGLARQDCVGDDERVVVAR